MRNLLIWWGVNAVSIFVVAGLLPGVDLADGLGPLLLVALVVGLVNAILRPILYLLSCGLIVLTLGLAIPILNAVLLLLADELAGDAFNIDGFWWALLAAILMGILNAVLHSILKPDKEKERHRVIDAR